MANVERREFMKLGGGAAVLAWTLPALGSIEDAIFLFNEADDVYAKAIVIDMMSDEPLDEAGKKNIRASGVTCISPTIGVRRPQKPQGTHMLKAFPRAAAIEDCATWAAACRNNADLLLPCMKVADIHRAKRERKTAVMLNFQNATHIEDDLDNINMFFNLGVRSMQLTYNERNLLGDGSTERTDAGLSDFGVLAIERMNELGMLVDSGHCGHQTTNEAVLLSKKTPIISHANCYALNAHPRNKTDDQIRSLAARGGVMGLTTASILIKKGASTTLRDFMEHVEHIIKLVGIDHVACGSDQMMRGWPTDAAGQKEFNEAFGADLYKASYEFRYPLATEGVNDPLRWYAATAAMIKLGYKEEDILKFLGGNWLRVFKENFG